MINRLLFGRLSYFSNNFQRNATPFRSHPYQQNSNRQDDNGSNITLPRVLMISNLIGMLPYIYNNSPYNYIRYQHF